MEEVLHALAALHCNNTRKLSPMLVNVYSREHPDALFLVTSRIFDVYSLGRVSGVACPLLFIRPLYKFVDVLFSSYNGSCLFLVWRASCYVQTNAQIQ